MQIERNLNEIWLMPKLKLNIVRMKLIDLFDDN